MTATWSAVPLALAAGLTAGFNPCCLPLYPAAVAACSSLSGSTVRANAGVAGGFVVGSALATAVLGVIAGLAGTALQPLGGAPIYALAAIPLLAGLHTLDVIRLPLPKLPELAPLRGVSALGAGASIALVVTPCSTPLVATTLAAAASTSSAVAGGLLLFVYGLGLGVPVVLVGTAAASATARFASAASVLKPLTGALQIAFGLWLVWLA